MKIAELVEAASKMTLPELALMMGAIVEVLVRRIGKEATKSMLRAGADSIK